jgi:acyl-coenzyme A thioesterase PaaI-like protein
MPRHGGGRRPFRGGSPATSRHTISAVTDDEHLFVCPTARDHAAIAVADVALALAGNEVADYTRQLELRITLSGETTAEEAVADIIARYATGRSRDTAPT